MDERITKLENEIKDLKSKLSTHYHTGKDSKQISSSNIVGFQSLPTSYQQYLNPSTGLLEYGFLAPQNLGISSPNALSQSMSNNPLALYPIVCINGFGVGIYSAFNGGAAPDGTIIGFSNAGTTGQLWLRIEGVWRGVALPLTA